MKNYHTHTKRCRHAVGEDRDYVQAAIEAGFDELGFSDHAPMIFKNEHISSFRMFLSDAEDYVASVRSLQAEYSDKIKIKLGFELEYYPALFEDELKYLKSFGYDYLILGQHYTDNEYEPEAHYSGAQTDSEEILDKYISQALDGLKTGEFLYIAHPDLINFTGDNEIYKEKMTGFCREIKKLDIPLEFNRLGFATKRNYPNKDFWQIARDVGNKAAIGIDAHNPDALRDMKTYGEMLDYLEALGISPIEINDGRKTK